MPERPVSGFSAPGCAQMVSVTVKGKWGDWTAGEKHTDKERLNKYSFLQRSLFTVTTLTLTAKVQIVTEQQCRFVVLSKWITFIFAIVYRT